MIRLFDFGIVRQLVVSRHDKLLQFFTATWAVPGGQIQNITNSCCFNVSRGYIHFFASFLFLLFYVSI